MSIQAVAWVLDHSDTKGAPRLVLLSLANHANEADECWPSIRRIAYEANVTEEYAQKCIGELVAGGHIIRVVNGAPDQRMRWDRRPNLYRITYGGVRIHPPWFNERGGTESGTGGETTRSRGGTESPPNHQKNHQEPSQSAAIGGVCVDDRFDEFWTTYPRRDRRRDAEVEWRVATLKVDAQRIINAARRYAEDPERRSKDARYTMVAANWLSGERWTDEPAAVTADAMAPEAATQAAARKRYEEQAARDAGTACRQCAGYGMHIPDGSKLAVPCDHNVVDATITQIGASRG